MDASAAVMRALAEPLDYPPLAAGIVPGDRVAIAVDGAVPCVASVVRGAVASLREAGVEAADISVVATDVATAERCRAEMNDGGTAGVQFVVHNPADENDLCLVGTMKRGEPLLVNRTIFDADVVLPIGCARVNERDAYESLFPRFSNAGAVKRYRTPSHHESGGKNGKMTEADEAGWMIGVPMTVQVVPGSGETVAEVIAGEPQAVARRSRELCRERWLLTSLQKASLVVMTVTGGEESQTWANVGRALAGTEELVEENGAVVICTNMAESPGHSLGRLIGNPDLDMVSRKILNDHDADSWAAWYLARALQRGPVYLLSQLSEETVEDLGLAPVESVEDLVRLVGRHENFAVVDGAQHVVVEVVEG
ncbi:MAG: lactate racemase domain-containing protein [Pirellulales bacterium]